MELRKKPIFWQRLLETLFRLRLIFLLLSGVLLLLLFFSRNELFSLILAASESFSIKVNSGLNLAELKPYFPLFGGVIAIFIVPFALFVLDGSDNVIIKLLLWCSLISILLSFLVPKAWVKSLFALFIGALLLSGFAVWTEVSLLSWACLLILFFADALTVGWYTGEHLKEGKPKAGSIIQASLKQLPVIAIGTFVALAISLYVEKLWSLEAVLSQSLFWMAYQGVFYLIFSPHYSFMSLDRLRSQKRRVK